MPKARRKNASREIRDIRFPTSHVPEKSAAGEVPIRKVLRVPAPRPPLPVARPRRRFPLGPVALFLCVLLLAAAVSGAVWYRRKAEQLLRLRESLGQTNLAAPLPELPSSLGDWVAIIKAAISNLGGIEKPSIQAIGAVDRTSSILRGIPAKFIAQDGPAVVADLAALRDSLQILGDSLRAFADGGEQSLFAGLSRYAAYAPDVDRARQTVEGLLTLLQSPGERHLLVLFGNSAELRPGGGFLGSFADISFGSSTIGDVVVHDVNEVDRGLAANIIPPKPMQGIVTRWRAADANWFFDYPDSARKTLQMMGRSSFYASSTLDGAILISPKVIQDLLSITGPVLLADGKTTVDADNVISMIQREVQAGQANGAENPKEILSELLPSVEKEFSSLSAAELESLAVSARNWILNKDVAVFVKDPGLAKVASHYNADGGLYAVPQSFAGDYLAAVNANLGGGKSDARINDTVDFESYLRADGVIESRVAVIRESGALASDDWWYRVANQDYLQVFTPPGATLTAASGGRARVIAPRTNYAKGFEADPDLVALESTLKPAPGFPAVSQFRESGKNVFATWLTTPPGGTGTARFEYRRTLKTPFRDGGVYTFVFERQSGARQSLRVVLNAPPGFVWRQNGLSKYEYFNEATPGRVVLDLSLRAI